MIIQKINWWLWNQMFQYAYVKALSLRMQTDFLLDLHEYDHYFRPYELEVFDIDKNYAKLSNIPRYERLHSSNKYINFLYFKLQWLCKECNPHHHSERNLQYNEKLLSIVDGYIDWYFQTEKYFIDYENEIRSDFIFVPPPSKQNQQTIDMINWCNSVSIHIRRWDYLKGNNPNFHGTCSLDYYHRAIDLIVSKIADPVFFVFSDDIDRVKDNLKIDNTHYIDRNTAETNYEDMRLMSECKHNIIANSSFSRWWAWLNSNPDKMVIAPERRFATDNLNYQNIIPASWIQI